VTLCRRGGARADVLERVSHNSRGGAIIDVYTHFDWQPLCEAVLCMRLEWLPDAPPLGGSTREPQLPGSTDIGDISRANPMIEGSTPSSSTAPLLTPGDQESPISERTPVIQGAIQGLGVTRREAKPGPGDSLLNSLDRNRREPAATSGASDDGWWGPSPPPPTAGDFAFLRASGASL
jgi:hypothetical protein